MDGLTAAFEQTILGNELWRFLALFIGVLGGFLIGKLCGYLFLRSADRAGKRGHEIIQVALRALGKTSGLIGFLIGFTAGFSFMSLGESAASVAATSEGVLASLVFGLLAWRLIDVPHAWMLKSARETDKKMSQMLVPVVQRSLQILVVILIILQIVQVISDKEITSILAGLGIGGLAFALAAQDSLKNVFGSILIFLDKPFQVGERIVYDGHDGVVEEVGLRSTRIRLLTGHLVVAPNSDVSNKAIVNIGRRPHIRRLTNITITYNTPPEKIQRALDIIRQLLDNHEGMDPEFPPRAYFNEFNAASLNILVIYWYHPPAYWDYLAFSEKFNLELVKRYNEEGIEFAFPTQTLYLASDNQDGLPVSLTDYRKQ